MGPIVWVVPLDGAHSEAVIVVLRARAFDVHEWNPADRLPDAQATGQAGVLVADIADGDDAVRGSCRFARIKLPHLFLLPGRSGIEHWLSKCGVGYFAIKPVSLEAVETYLRILLGAAGGPPFDLSLHAGASLPENTGSDRWGVGRGDPVCVDDDAKQVRVEGKDLHLSPKEFELLSLLASRPGHVFSTEEIIASVWKQQGHATSLDVQQYVHHLRRKIERDPASPRLIRNVKGFGYLLDCDDTG